VEHGISPSSMISRMLAPRGTPSQAAIAAGALSIGDPRAMARFDVASREGASGLHCRLVRFLGEEISRRRGRPLPVNVNGAIVAVLLDLEFAEVTVRGLVIGARVFGLTAHVAEDLDQSGRWRHVDADAVECAGPVSD
jgi:hypothetical protein